MDLAWGKLRGYKKRDSVPTLASVHIQTVVVSDNIFVEMYLFQPQFMHVDFLWCIMTVISHCPTFWCDQNEGVMATYMRQC